MKKILVFLGAMVIGVAFAQTINVNWKVDNTTYATNTCEYGGTLTVPSTPPTKYGYHFVGWNSYAQLSYVTVSNLYVSVPATMFDLSSDFELEFVWKQTKPTNTFSPIIVSPYQNGAWFGGYNSGNFVVREYNGINIVAAALPSDLTTYKITRVGNVFSLYYNGVLKGTNTDANFVYDSSKNHLLFTDNADTSIANLAQGVLKEISFNGNKIVPAKINNEVGLYDTSSGTFLKKTAGTGEFIAGPELQQ